MQGYSPHPHSSSPRMRLQTRLKEHTVATRERRLRPRNKKKRNCDNTENPTTCHLFRDPSSTNLTSWCRSTLQRAQPRPSSSSAPRGRPRRCAQPGRFSPWDLLECAAPPCLAPHPAPRTARSRERRGEAVEGGSHPPRIEVSLAQAGTCCGASARRMPTPAARSGSSMRPPTPTLTPFLRSHLQASQTTRCSPSISLWTLDSELVLLPLQQFLPTQASPWYFF